MKKFTVMGLSIFAAFMMMSLAGAKDTAQKAACMKKCNEEAAKCFRSDRPGGQRAMASCNKWEQDCRAKCEKAN